MDTIHNILKEIGIANLNEVSRVSGGDICKAYKVRSDQHLFFVKVLEDSETVNALSQEKENLDLISQHYPYIPKPFKGGRLRDYHYLLMEYIPTIPATPEHWEQFGTDLAEMHQSSNEKFGLSYNNFIGTLDQSNAAHDSAHDFFWEERLNPLIRKSLSNQLLETSDVERFEKLAKKLEDILPDEPPALIHGDLWSGNFLHAEKGTFIFDPACHYGLREADIAMSLLFGGFDRSFYDAYNQVYPLEKGWQNRMDLLNLYPLLVHLILFGRSYYGQISQILNKFVA
ncbi:MAG: fructosamine kinase family protein [Flavobacteriales bacterium]|nr:fructosamine kinase family protein [Flavobacteriales bacterium]